MKSYAQKQAIAQKVLPLLEAIYRKRTSERMSGVESARKEADPNELQEQAILRKKQFVCLKNLRVENPFHYGKRRQYITCDDFYTWGGSLAFCRHNNKYAIYHKNKGLVTPFIFDAIEDLVGQNYIKMKWASGISVCLCEHSEKVIFGFDGSIFHDFESLLRAIVFYDESIPQSERIERRKR